ncbi:MAG: FtsX-like permease family protein [Marinoscillum sp.]
MKSNPQPPNWPDKLLSRFCRPELADEILGDLHEAFHWRVDTIGVKSARRKFIWECLKSIKPSNLRSFHHLSLNTMIIRNYLKIAFRNLLKRKSFSFINIFGLATGVAAFILIFLYAIQILTFDDFHEKKDSIFLVYKERITPDGTQPTYDTWVPMKDRLLSEYPDIQSGARVYSTEARVIKNNQYIEENILYTDESFFDVFSFRLKFGNSDQPFQDKSSIVLLPEIALKYFGKENAIGEEMELFIPDEDTTLRFYVSGILAEYPTNTSLQPNMVIQMEGLPFYPRYASRWDNSFIETYVLLDDPNSAQSLELAFPNLVESIWGAEVMDNTNFKLLPYTAYYDNFVGSKKDARTLVFIGLGILLIAIINFMNLSTAQASQRSKEIGLRKVLGAFKGQLRSQFMTEAMVVSLLSALFGVGLVLLGTPYFNEFFGVTISLLQYPITQVLVFIFMLTLLLGFLSGSYPALYLSSVKVLDVLRQKFSFGKSVGLRNALVIVQFAIAVFLISSTLLIRNQIYYMADKDMGFDPGETLIINASAGDFLDRDQGIVKLNTFKNELKSKSYMKAVTMSRSVPTFWTRSFMFVRPDGWTGDPLRMRFTYLDAHFFDTYDIEIKYGNHFLPDSEGDQRNSVILNEAAMKAFEFTPENNNVIKIGETSINVVGVVEDFNFESLQNEVAPTLMFHRTAEHAVHRYITCKMEMTGLSSKMEEIEAMWKNLGATKSIDYTFMNDRIDRLYESEQRYMALITLFSIISIIIACLGLYGLTLFIIEKRQKEISIRKVLGAEVKGLISLIFKDFAKWVIAAFAIGIPVVIYFISGWLENYHYRIDISWITFAMTLITIIVLVTITVGYQSLRAANSNPVKYLKDE